ncbi:MAG: hypothetical protein H0T12_01890 [Actinobacteria bacterium]|nr:hypothetical protein [Actinomycetota bacterium]
MPADVEVVAAVVAACPSVARLYGGRAAEVATYLPGRRVEGVRFTEDELEVHVVAAWDVPLPEVADEVRGAAAPVGGGLPVAVFIDDVDIPPALLGADEPPEDSTSDPLAETSLAPPSAPLPGEVVVVEESSEDTGLTAPVEPIPPSTLPEVPLTGDPVTDPLAPDPLATDPVTSPVEADLLLAQPGPAPPPAPGDPVADVLPGEILPDDPVLEDEIAGDVIPGEPVPPPPPAIPTRPNKKRPSKGRGSK